MSEEQKLTDSIHENEKDERKEEAETESVVKEVEKEQDDDLEPASDDKKTPVESVSSKTNVPSQFYAMRLNAHVTKTVANSSEFARDLVNNGKLLKTLFNEYNETLLAYKASSKSKQRILDNKAGGPPKPLIIYVAQSVVATWSMPKPLNLNKMSEAAIVSDETMKSANEMMKKNMLSAKENVTAFTLIVDSIERQSHETVARCVCIVRAYYSNGKDNTGKELTRARKAKTLVKRVQLLNKLTYLTIVRANITCEDMTSKSILVRAQLALKRYDEKHPPKVKDHKKDDDEDDVVDDADPKRVALLKELLGAMRNKTVMDAGLETALRLHKREVLSLQNYDLDIRSRTLVNYVLTDSNIFAVVGKRIEENKSRAPTLVSFHTRYGCPIYGKASYKISSADAFISEIEELKEQSSTADMAYFKSIIDECNKRSKEVAGANSMIMMISDEGNGPLLGEMHRCFIYIPNIMEQRDYAIAQQKAIDDDIKNMTSMEKMMGLEALNLNDAVSDEDELVSRQTNSEMLMKERDRIKREHNMQMDALKKEFNEQLDAISKRFKSESVKKKEKKCVVKDKDDVSGNETEEFSATHDETPVDNNDAKDE